MKFLIDHLSKPNLLGLGILFSVVSICLLLFSLLKKIKPGSTSTELHLRTRSWFYIAAGLSVIISFPKTLGLFLLAFVSFVALRELYSIVPFRAADRTALMAGYLSIPLQYLFIYNGWENLSFAFIPIIFFVGIPFLLIANGNVKGIGKSMALIPATVMLSVFMISHVGFLVNIVSDQQVGAAILFLFCLTAANDVFQYIWGKLIGGPKIVPKISPNKTWAGFVGGILTTSLLGIALQFLTPFNLQEAFLVGLSLGIAGFAGDILVSAIKRDLKIKDTGDLIPGHGGALDRLDSLVLTAPVFYYLTVWLTEIEMEVLQNAEYAIEEVILAVNHKLNLLW